MKGDNIKIKIDDSTNELEESKEIIFQVRIDRKDQTFDLVKTGLSTFEQTGFESFLTSYINCIRKEREKDIDLDYFGEEEE